MTSPLNNVQFPIDRRYDRQIKIREIGPAGQENLKDASVLLVGAGGLGSSAAFYLAAAGIGRIGIMDHDVVDESNLNRQILYGPSDIGTLKAVSAANTLAAFNPGIRVEPLKCRLSDAVRSEKILAPYDIILDCTDNFNTRDIINQACISLKKPWIYAAVTEFEGQVMKIIPGQTPCYRCLYPTLPSMSQGPQAPPGVLGVTPGLFGILEAAEALKYLLGFNRREDSKLFFGDLADLHFRSLTNHRRPDCPACGCLFDTTVCPKSSGKNVD